MILQHYFIISIVKQRYFETPVIVFISIIIVWGTHSPEDLVQDISLCLPIKSLSECVLKPHVHNRN